MVSLGFRSRAWWKKAAQSWAFPTSREMGQRRRSVTLRRRRDAGRSDEKDFPRLVQLSSALFLCRSHIRRAELSADVSSYRVLSMFLPGFNTTQCLDGTALCPGTALAPDSLRTLGSQREVRAFSPFSMRQLLPD